MSSIADRESSSRVRERTSGMKRHTWLAVGRFIVFETLVILGILFMGWDIVGRVYLAVGAMVILTSGVYLFHRSRRPEARWTTWTLFLLDALLAAVVIQMAGGFDGPFAILFFVHTFAAGAYLGVRGGVVAAVLNTLLSAALALVSISGVIKIAGSPLAKLIDTLPRHLTTEYAILLILINGCFLVVTGLVSGYLSEHIIFEQGRVQIAMNELGRARAMSREILESLSDGVLVIDRSGQPISMNRAGISLLDLGPQWRETVLDTEVYTMLREFQRAADLAPIVEISLDDRVLECRMGVFQDNTGNPAGALAALTDITETLNLKRKLQEQEKLAVVGRLSSTLAHEIRNPLASMSGAAHVLRMGGLEWEKADRMTLLISRQARRISEIIEGYLELSRSRKTLYTDAVPLESVVTEAVEVARQGFGWQTRIELHIDGSFLVLGSQSRLVQLLTNLMRNSAESMNASPEGRVDITLCRGHAEGTAMIKVEDNGPGIAPEIMDRIRDPFFTTKLEGTGLGLYVARRVAEDHRGTLMIESTPGQGTTVSVVLPLAPADMTASRTGGTTDG
jgi:signal transduction histidine kinase